MGYGRKDNTIGPWSLEKLEFIRMYLPAFAKATRKALHRYYIDAFAGAGEWYRRDDFTQKVEGSVAIALQHANMFTKLYFIEQKSDRVEKLKDLVRRSNVTNAIVIHGDSNKEIPEILKSIHREAPTFVFLDPSGDHVEWKTVEILSKWRTELFILYPWNMTLVRYLKRDKNILPPYRERLNRFFGTDMWYQIYINYHRDYLFHEMLNLYVKRLKDLGYKYINISDVFETPDGTKLYYMIWAGKKEVAKKIMDWVYHKLSSPKLFDNNFDSLT